MKTINKVIIAAALSVCLAGAVDAKPRITGGNQPALPVKPPPVISPPLRPSIEEWWPFECWFYWPRARLSCQQR